MALYSIAGDQLKPVQTTTFAQEAILERKHLQAMLRQDTSPLGEDLLVLCEEFGNWQDSNRRIDLLCLDKTGGLVVVEIKRTEDGGHMELQAKLLESDLLMQQAMNNSKEQFSNSPDLASELMNAIIDAFEAHGTMSKQALDSEKVRQGLKHILLGPAELYEALRQRGSAAR